MSIYSKYSPYFSTSIVNNYLDVINFRAIPSSVDDPLYEIPKTYENRPDLLAYELYDDVNLWWVFAVRNPSIIKDPIYDMVAGVKIYLPNPDSVKSSLGG